MDLTSFLPDNHHLQKVVPIPDQANKRYPEEIWRWVYEDHHSIARFEAPDNQTYKHVCLDLQAIIHKANTAPTVEIVNGHPTQATGTVPSIERF